MPQWVKSNALLMPRQARCIEYMMQKTGMHRHECEAECYRYEAWPGACPLQDSPLHLRVQLYPASYPDGTRDNRVCYEAVFYPWLWPSAFEHYS